MAATMPDDREFAYGHLKLRHLYLMRLLESEKSITRAAQAMHLTQPAVSAMLKELETQFGIRMVERNAQGVLLTPAARAALRRFSIALAEVGAGHEEALRAQQHERLRLRVGALTLATLELIPEALSLLLEESPDVQIEISEGTVDGLTDTLMRGELDCIIGRVGAQWAKFPNEARIEQLKLYDEHRCLVCRPGHALAARRRVDLATLAEHHWVLQPVPSSTRLVFDELFLERGMVPPVPTVESVSAHSNMEIVAATDLLGIAPLAVARPHIATGRLHAIAPEAALARISISLIWRRASGADPLLARLRRALVAAGAARNKRNRRARQA
jgi:DNA-binding transcriptional LysR family regulator